MNNDDDDSDDMKKMNADGDYDDVLMYMKIVR
jgi:hypothetical protein